MLLSTATAWARRPFTKYALSRHLKTKPRSLADDGFRDPDTGQIQGDDTHYMFFDVAPGVPLDAPVYTNFADQDSRGFYPAGGPQVDSITALLASGGPGQTITDGIASATVPEPAGAIVFFASGLVLLRRRGRTVAP